MKRERSQKKVLSPEGKPYAAKLQSADTPAKIPAAKFGLWISVIIVATLVSYSTAFDNELTNWDDDQYVIENPYLKELSVENLKDIFSTYYMGNYHPLAMLSLSADYQIGGEDADGNIKPFMFHFTGIFLHLLVTLLVFVFVRVMFSKFKIAVIAALLFGIHTLHVESVAWVSERKDVLYAVFFMASLFTYVKYVRRSKLKFLFVSFFFFVLSLLSKGQAVSLAVTLVLIDWYERRDLKSRKVIAEKIPFFLLSILFGIIAIKAQQDGNAIISSEAYSPFQRIAFAGYAFATYIFELLLPVNLAAINPYPDIIHKTMPAYYWLFLIPSAGVVVAFFYTLKKSRIFAFAIAFFVINIVLLLQLIPVGSALHADRYAYIPSIGFFIFVAWGIQWLYEKNYLPRALVYSILSIYSIMLIYLTINRCNVWKDGMTLWEDTVKKSPKAVVAWNNKGSLLDQKATEHEENSKKGLATDPDLVRKYRKAAIDDFTKAIEYKPDYTHAFYNRGRSKYELAKSDNDTALLKTALEDFNQALKFNPLFAEAYHTRGSVYDFLNQTDLAIKDYNAAIELDKTDAAYYANRGVAYGKKGDYRAAVEDFNRAAAINPDDPGIYSNRGYAYVLLEDFDNGMRDYNRSIQMEPSPKAYYNRALLKQRLSDTIGAVSDLNQSIRLNPLFTDAYYMRGVLNLGRQMKDNACKDFRKAADMGHYFAAKQYEINCK